jgi:hypothetical protein
MVSQSLQVQVASAGISIHFIVGELPILLGISDEPGHLLMRLFHILGRL